jgi:RNA polymerase sigma factor (sigma-70 family)
MEKAYNVAEIKFEKEYLLLVVDRALKMKNRYSYSSVSIMDLIEEGNIALIRSAELYRADHKSKASFATYAVRAIDSKLMDLVKSDRTIYLPDSYLSVRAAVYKLRKEFDGELTDEDIIEKLNITKETITVLKNDHNVHVSYLEDIGSDEGSDSAWNDIIEDKGAVSPDKKATQDSLREYLLKYMQRLNPRERELVERRYLGNDYPTYDQLSIEFKVSRERIRQIDFRALRSLKKFLLNDYQAKHGKPIPKESRHSYNPYGCYNFGQGYMNYLNEMQKIREEGLKKAFKHILRGV